MKNIYVLIVIFLSCHFSISQNLIDKGKFLKKNDIKMMEEQISSIQNTTGIDIFIYTTKSLKGNTAKNFGIDLFNKKSIGQRGVNNGVLILLSQKEKALQIINGFGIEWILTDSISNTIVEEMITFFRNGNFTEGVNEGLKLMDDQFQKQSWLVETTSMNQICEGDSNKIFKFIYSNTLGNKFPSPSPEGHSFLINIILT
jgi:uncharacterized protein